jgi:hypothetical protein
LRSIFLEPGHYDIEFKFTPRSTTWGLWVSMLMLLILSALLLTVGYLRLYNWIKMNKRRGAESQ